MAAKIQQPTIKADLKANRLYITFHGNIRKVDVEKTYTDIRFAVADLQQGFDVINDLTNCSLGQLSGMGSFKKITDYLTNSGVSRVVRVVGKGSIIFKQISRLSTSIIGYSPEYAASMEEAERLLTEKKEQQVA